VAVLVVKQVAKPEARQEVRPAARLEAMQPAQPVGRQVEDCAVRLGLVHWAAVLVVMQAAPQEVRLELSSVNIPCYQMIHVYLSSEDGKVMQVAKPTGAFMLGFVYSPELGDITAVDRVAGPTWSSQSSNSPHYF
jgi:hypothetical protein